MWKFILGSVLTVVNVRAAWTVLKDIWKSARGVKGATRVSKKVKLPLRTWADRFWASLISIFMLAEVADFLTTIGSKAFGFGMLAFANAFPEAARNMVAYAADKIASYEGLAGILAANTMNTLVGTNIDARGVADNFAGTPSRNTVINIGTAFQEVVTTIFDIEAARGDMSTRTGFTGSLGNLSAFFGTNILFQMRSLTIATVASLSGLHSLRHLEQLHQSINWAFGFGWLSWAVMSEYMNVTVNPGVRRILNQQVKPNDISGNRAYELFLRAWIDNTVLNQVLDNEGERDDIREWELGERETKFRESEVQRQFELGNFAEAELLEWVRRDGMLNERALRKTEWLKAERLEKIRDRNAELQLRQFRDCVITEDQARAALANRGFRTEEIAEALQESILEREQRRFLSRSDLFKAFDEGLLREDEVRESLTCQGYTSGDIDIIFALEVGGDELQPRIRAFSVRPGTIDPGADIEIEWRVENADSVTISPRPGEVDSAGATIIDGPTSNTVFTLTATNPEGTVTREQGVIVRQPEEDLQKLRIRSFSVRPGTVLPGQQIELQWRVDNADTVTISPRPGVVIPARAGAVIIDGPLLPTVFTLTATNAAGESDSRQEAVLIRFPQLEFPSGLAPVIRTFRFSPGSARPGQEIELEWDVEGADDINIQPLIGEVGASGNQIVTLDQTTTFTLTASNNAGDSIDRDSVIIRVPEEEAAAAADPPTGSFSIRPGTAEQLQEIEVSWNVRNADLVTITPTVGVVPASGSRVINAPASTTIFTLNATGPGGALVRQEALIIRPPREEQPDIPPAPSGSFSVRPGTADAGQEVEINWNIRNADTIDISPGVGGVGASGARVVAAPASTTVFTLQAVGPGGTMSQQEALIIRPPDEPPAPRAPTASLSVRPGTVDAGDFIEVSWRTSRADSVQITPGLGFVPAVGSRVITASQTTTFRLVAEGPGGQVAAEDSVIVRPPAPPPEPGTFPAPTASLGVAPTFVDPGERVRITWRTRNADEVRLEPLGEVLPVDATDFTITQDTKFTLVAIGPGGETRDATIVLLRPQSPEPVP